MTGREENRRAVIYARYKSENQREASIEDQAGEILRRLSDKIVLTPRHLRFSCFGSRSAASAS